RSFTHTNDTFISAATELGEAAVRRALAGAGLAPADVDALFVASTTGIASPSIDARLMNRLELRSDVRRVPIVGLGCSAGAAGLGLADAFVRGMDRRVALVLCVELCSLTFQPDDASIQNLVATGLFGDAAACAVVARVERPHAGRPEIVGARSMFIA